MRTVLVTVVAIALLTPANVSSGSCYCGDTSLRPELLESSTVFAGRVASIDTLGMGAMFSVHFDVTDVWSGSLEREKSVFTYHNMFCGYSFQVGMSYIVVASIDERHGLKTGLCSGTRIVYDASEFYAVLGEPRQRYELHADEVPEKDH